MPGYLLHPGAVVTCAHGAQAVPIASYPRVRVAGVAIVTLGTPYSITVCPLPPPPMGNGPCVNATFTTSAVRVRAGGLPVLLSDGSALCMPTGTPLTVVNTQTRVKGI
ncbi:hypothetical protein J5X84_24250 [Streptosporangiaceae bacterium NEAU-GS5]|nr:hypothetical protein [Streptosporangiaceae bacterium NEAU-GS5]